MTGAASREDSRRAFEAKVRAAPRPPARQLHIYDPESGRIVESLALTAEQAAALDRLPGHGRHLRAIVLEGR